MPSKLAGRSILIVEDEPLIAMEVVDAFKSAGAVVTTTFSFKQALILVEHDGLDAAILDHALGENDSSQLCARLKERDIPFVTTLGSARSTASVETARLCGSQHPQTSSSPR